MNAPQWHQAIQKAPPNDDTLVIARIRGGQYQVGTGKMMHQLFHLIRQNKAKIDTTWMWNNHTDELWELLKPR